MCRLWKGLVLWHWSRLHLEMLAFCPKHDPYPWASFEKLYIQWQSDSHQQCYLRESMRLRWKLHLLLLLLHLAVLVELKWIFRKKVNDQIQPSSTNTSIQTERLYLFTNAYVLKGKDLFTPLTFLDEAPPQGLSLFTSAQYYLIKRSVLIKNYDIIMAKKYFALKRYIQYTVYAIATHTIIHLNSVGDWVLEFT